MLGLLPISAAAKAYLALVLTIWAASAGLPVPEEVPLLTIGVLAALGVVDLWGAIAVALFACLSGDILVFVLGRRIGSHLNEHRYLRRIMRGRALLRARYMYVRRGPWALFFARWLPGLKMPFLFTAGALRMPWKRFLIYDIASISILVPTIVLVAYHSSFSLPQLQHLVHEVGILGTIVFLVFAGVLVAAWSIRYNRRRARRHAEARRRREYGHAAHREAAAETHQDHQAA